MKSKKIWVGMLAMALIFGMTVISCDNSTTNNGGGNGGSGGYNHWLGVDFSTAAPSTAALNAGGLTQAQFNQIRDAAGGGFQGWAIEDGALVMAWTGRSAPNFTSTANTLRNLFGENERDIDEDIRFAEGNRHALFFASVGVSEDGYYFPAGFMWAGIWRP